MKYVIFHDAADASYTNTVENFRGAYASAQVVTAYFHSAAADSGTPGVAGYDAIAMACTNGEEDRAIEELTNAMSRNGAVQIIADDVNSVYACQNITGVNSITLSATGNYRNVEAITNAAAVTRTLTAAESGKLFTLDMTAVDNNVTLTLPLATTAGTAGVYFDFVYLANCDDDADFILTTGADAVDFFGGIVAGGANSTIQDVDGDASKLTVDGSVAQTTEGLRMTVVCDGANWHLTGYNKTVIGTALIVLATAA